MWPGFAKGTVGSIVGTIGTAIRKESKPRDIQPRPRDYI